MPLPEAVLPTGAMHLVFMLSGRPLRLLDGPHDPIGEPIGLALVGGARAAPLLRDISTPGASVGAMLRVGAAQALFGVPADALTGRHVPLDALWGPAAEILLDRLRAVGDPLRRLALFEAALLRRLARSDPPAPDPTVAEILPALAGPTPIATLAARAGVSDRHFIATFRAASGLAPQRYRRLLRFRAALHGLARQPDTPLVDLALAAGYSDQPHWTREFQEFAGMTPGQWRRASPRSPEHVPLSPLGPPGPHGLHGLHGPIAPVEPAHGQFRSRSGTECRLQSLPSY
ncbi:MAG: helix-turn-helix domain-containing protein [Lautropia sp.]